MGKENFIEETRGSEVNENWKIVGQKPGVAEVLATPDTPQGKVMRESEIAHGIQGEYERDGRSQKVSSEAPVDLGVSIDVSAYDSNPEAKSIDMNTEKLRMLMSKLDEAKAAGNQAAIGVITQELDKLNNPEKFLEAA